MRRIEEILMVLRRELRQGRYPSGRKFVSERMLMNRFQAARITVNKVTELLVQEGFIIRGEQGAGTYVRNISPFPSGHIAYLGPVVQLYYARIIEGAQRIAALNGLALSVFQPTVELMTYYLDRISESRYQGVLAAGMGILPETFKLPVIYLDNSSPKNGEKVLSVTCENYGSACRMAETALDRGHREILLCSSRIPTEFSREQRMKGFAETLEKHGIKNVAERTFWSPLTGSDHILKQMLERFPKTTLILTDSDSVAFKLWRIAYDMNIERKLTFTGFGDTTTTTCAIPTVNQHPEEIGERGMQEMIDLVEHPENFIPHEIKVEAELVNRDMIPYI